MTLITKSSLKKVNPIGVQGVRVIDLHQQLSLLIKSRTRIQGCADLFPEPRLNPDSGELSWYTSLDGDIRKFSDLDEQELALKHKLLTDLVLQIKDVINILESSGNKEQQLNAAYLHTMLKHLEEVDLYCIGDQPLLVNWACGPATPGASPVDLSGRLSTPMSVTSNPVVENSPVALPSAASTIHSNQDSPGSVVNKPFCWGWLGWILALIVLLLILWFALDRYTGDTKGDINAIIDERLALQNTVLNLGREIYEANLACGTLSNCKEYQEEPVAREKAPRPEFTGDPVKATDYCKPESIVKPALIIVMDNSGSMRFPINMPTALDDKVNEQYYAYMDIDQVKRGLSQLLPGLIPDNVRIAPSPEEYLDQLEQQYGGPFRSVVAKQVITELVEQAPDDAQVGVVVFSDCNDIQSVSTHNEAERTRAVQVLSGLQPQSATPIAYSLQKAVQMVDGTTPESPAIIIMVTDGVESCDANPCAIARAAKQAKPYLAVHMVKLGDSTAAECIAGLTGGKVYDSRNVGDLASVLDEASITAPFELGCNE